MPELSDSELAARFGFAMAVLNSDPELKKLFEKAVAGSYSADRFQAELRATKWYQTHSESWRNAVIQKKSDPATYKAMVGQVQTRLGMMASELGARLGAEQLAKLSESAYMFGWDDNQIRAQLATYVRYTDGRLLGQAGQWETDLRSYAADMGLSWSDKQYRTQITAAIQGKKTVDDIKSAMRQVAKSAFPHLADRLDAGETVADIAEPYRQTMGQLLEVDPESVGLRDQMIKQALGGRDKDGKPVLKTLWEFEQDVRKDKRWLKSQNAQDSVMSVASRVLSDMGLV